MREDKQFVSIVIPVYNRENLILETVNTALSQTYQNLEIVIVDNRSTDNTWLVLKEISLLNKKIRIFRNEENVGPVKNWIRCLELAKGDYVKILFSDDLISSTFVEKTMRVFENDVAFVLTQLSSFSEDSESISKYKCSNSKINIEDYINQMILGVSEKNYPVSPGAAIFRKNDLKKNLFVEINNTDSLIFNKYGAGVDLLIFLLTAKRYKYFMCIPENETKFRNHKNSFSIANDLTIYYDWAKFYFVKNYEKKLLSSYSSLLLVKYLLNPKYYKFNIISELFRYFSVSGLFRVVYNKFIK